MSTLFEPGEDLSATPPYVAYRILRLMEDRNTNRLSIFDVAVHFRDEKWFSANRVYMALTFMYALNLADFSPPYIEKNV